MVEHLHQALPDEVHVLNIRLVGDDLPVLRVDTTEHGDDELVDEASFALLKEVVEGTLKLFEDSSVLD